MKHKMKLAALTLGSLVALPSAQASLDPLGIWNGNVGLSIDGIGSNSTPVGSLQAHIPDGATLLGAYLYSAGTPHPWYADSPQTVADYNGAGITLAGSAVTYSRIVGATSDRVDIGRWYTGFADVTSVVAGLRLPGVSDYSWSLSKTGLNNRIDGEVLAIVYSDPSLPLGSVVLLDGGQDTGGETTTVNFGSPLGDTTDPGFFADMSLAISFSTGNSQHSEIDINGTRLSTSAGGFDDGGGFDGGLFTAGGIGDSNANPALPFSTSSAQDDELYTLVPFLSQGDTGFNVFTKNDSNDDNIFFMGLHVAATVTHVNQTPDAGTTLPLLGLALAGMSWLRRRV